MNRKNPPVIEQLAFLSVKHSVYLAELFQALVSARENGKSACMSLAVQYRGCVDNYASFLITKYSKVVAQLQAPEEILLRKNIHFETWLDTDGIRKQMSRQNSGSHLCTMVQDLRHGMTRVNVEAEVLGTPKLSTVTTRYGNNTIVTNVWIADETGKVKLCIWNKQANPFTEGETIQVRNASVSTFKGERQLNLGKTGTISVLQSQASRTKQDPAPIAKNAF